MCGVCPPTTPTIRIGISNTTPFFHPSRSHFEFFAVNNAKSTIKDFSCDLDSGIKFTICCFLVGSMDGTPHQQVKIDPFEKCDMYVHFRELVQPIITNHG